MAKDRVLYGLDAEASLYVNASLIIGVRAGELVAWERFAADPVNVVELHQMRIAAKRLRYTMEIFAPYYGKQLADAITRIKLIQEHLGNIHDLDVLAPELIEHVGTSLHKQAKAAVTGGVYSIDTRSANAMLAICEKKRRERELEYVKFLQEWRKLRTEAFFDKLRSYLLHCEEMARSAKKSEARTNG